MSSHVPGPLFAQGKAIMAIDHGHFTALARIVDKRLTPEAAEHNAVYLVNCLNNRDELVSALAPFAAMDFEHFDSKPDDWILFQSQSTNFTMGDYRRARLAMKRAEL